jgi:mannose-6-phosphate isomerase-like protein (cupin superfamily)
MTHNTTAAAPAPVAEASSGVRPARLFRRSAPGGAFRQRLTPSRANLDFLSCGEYELPGDSESQTFCLPREESLLFQVQGRARVTVNGQGFELQRYDSIYIPVGAELSLANPWVEGALVYQCSAPAEKSHPVHYSCFAEYSKREDRIRRLKGKDVYMMFDVSEAADKLVAGYTFFQPYQRSWPPHNHTDQEEVYIFIEGPAAMEVYESPEKLWWVHSVGPGDVVSIPPLNYHPVFSQEEPCVFIWCIAGERYWVGDKSKDFMSGRVDKITT